MENWKPIEGYEGYYEVSDLGNIRRIMPAIGTKAGRVLKPSKIPNRGYRVVFLSKNPKDRKAFRVCRLVAKAFIGKPPSFLHETNHKNGITFDDRVENLEWVTRSQNIRHRFDVLKKPNKRGENHGMSVITDNNAAIIKALRIAGASNGSIAKQFGLKLPTVKDITCGRSYLHVGPAKQIPEKYKANCLERPKGSGHPNSVLTEKNVLDIRESNSSGVDMARKYGVTPATISAIRNRKVWRHI